MRPGKGRKSSDWMEVGHWGEGLGGKGSRRAQLGGCGGWAVVSGYVQRALRAGISTNGAPGSCARQQVWVKEDIWGEAAWRTKVPELGKCS